MGKDTNKTVAVTVAAGTLGAVSALALRQAYSWMKSGGMPQKGPLKEFSVVYTDRAYNLMSSPFQAAMLDIDRILKKAYNADHTCLIPGSGSYAMEAVARQFGQDQKVVVIRNGYFSFR